MILQEATNWCNGQIGHALDYDGQYGCQCTDFVNYYIRFVTGKDAYAQGYAVPAAAQYFDVAAPTGWTKVANNPSDKNQVPPQGAFIVYSGAMPGTGGAGHVEVVDSADANGITVWNQNWGGKQYVQHLTHTWNNYVRGWLIPNFETPAPPSGFPKTVSIIVPTLNVRTGPGTNYPGQQANTPDGQLHQGNAATVTGQVTGGSYFINGVESDQWYTNKYGRYFAVLGTK